MEAWKFLIALNVAIAAVQTVCELTIGPGWLDQWLALRKESFLHGAVWQCVTYMFIHGGPGDMLGRIIHLMVNLLGIFWFGREVETALGRKHFLGIYFAGGLLGAASHLVLGPPEIGLAGASAGVLALLLAFTTILPNIDLTVLLFFFLPVRMKARHLALGFVLFTLLCIVIGMYQTVAHIPHLAGCLAGWVYARSLGYGRPVSTWFNRREEKELVERWKRMPTKDFISSEIDPILDKIAREGIHSLTRAERRILEEGRDRIAKKVSNK